MEKGPQTGPKTAKELDQFLKKSEKLLEVVIKKEEGYKGWSLPEEERERLTGVICGCGGYIVKTYYLHHSPPSERIGPNSGGRSFKASGGCHCKACGIMYNEFVLKQKESWQLTESD